MHELDEDIGTGIAVRRSRWSVIAGFLGALAIAAMAAWFRDIAFLLIATYAFIWSIGRARSVEFAIDKQGIRLPAARNLLRSSIWGLRDLGLYRWDEVSYCHWSHHNPGELNVQIKKTRSPDNVLEEPPIRIFYRVPEHYRADVEKELRARGKWAE